MRWSDPSPSDAWLHMPNDRKGEVLDFLRAAQMEQAKAEEGARRKGETFCSPTWVGDLAAALAYLEMGRMR